MNSKNALFISVAFVTILFIFSISWGYSFILAICCIIIVFVVYVIDSNKESEIDKLTKEYTGIIREITTQQPVASDIVSALYPIRNENKNYSYLINQKYDYILNKVNNENVNEYHTMSSQLIDDMFNSPTMTIKGRDI